MSSPKAARIADLPGFDTVIDARSPAEFALDHVPGAVNLPVLDDDERRIVGTLFKQRGAFEARRVGGAMVAAHLARHLQDHLCDRPAGWRPLVYCWRGGLRSGSMVTWLRLVGWDAQQLAGGYKSWRRHVVALIDERCTQLQWRVVCGATGSAKTRLLQALAARGAQVLDLEAAACHKGSLLGAVPGQPQPSQKQFETRIATVLAAADATRPLFVEGESARIGRVALPLPLVQQLRAAPCLELVATADERLSFLLRDYAYLGDDRASLAARMAQLAELHGKHTADRWQHWALAGALAPLFAELMQLHYDPHYARSQQRHFSRWEERQQLPAPDLSPAGIDALAAQLLAA